MNSRQSGIQEIEDRLPDTGQGRARDTQLGRRNTHPLERAGHHSKLEYVVFAVQIWHRSNSPVEGIYATIALTKPFLSVDPYI